MDQHRYLTRLAAAAGAAALTMLALAPAATAVDPDESLPAGEAYETYQQCPITQIDGQLFRCDVATDEGVATPAHIPESSFSTNG